MFLRTPLIPGGLSLSDKIHEFEQQAFFEQRSISSKVQVWVSYDKQPEKSGSRKVIVKTENQASIEICNKPFCVQNV